MSAFPPQLIVECRAGSLNVISGLPGTTSSKDQLEMALWKKIVAETAERNRETPLHVAYCGGANMITGYRLYYILEYAKRSGLKRVVLYTDGGFWLEEATRWLIESGVDQIVVTMGRVPSNLAALPIFERIAQIEFAKRAQRIAKPTVKIETARDDWDAVRAWWFER